MESKGVVCGEICIYFEGNGVVLVCFLLDYMNPIAILLILP